MSGYDDRRRDDRDDDFDDRPRRRDDDRGDDTDDRPRRGGGRLAAARGRVKVPAILLIVLGGLGVMFGGLNMIQLNQLPAQLDEAAAQQADKLDRDPNLTADQKQQQKQMMDDIIGFMKKLLPPMFVAQLVLSLVIVAGGVQMFRLAGRGLPITASVLAMIPVLSWCCLLGLPVGIWALVVLLNADVKAAFAARSAAPDGY